MKLVIGYAAVSALVLVASAFLLKRLEWPAAFSRRIQVAALLALAWPLTLPVASFGGVVAARLIRTGEKKDVPADGVGAFVSPAAASL